MIIYEYRCFRCDERFDLRRRMDCRDEPATCPECGAAGFRVFSKPAVPRTVWATGNEAEQILRSEEVWR